jgi:hypothetical protein
MRQLKSSEKKLLLATGALALSLVTIMLTFYLFNVIQKIERQITKLEHQKKQNQTVLADKKLWETREAWLAQHLQAAPPSGIANALLLTNLQSAARFLDVQILEQRFLQQEPDAILTTAGAELTVSAKMKNLVKWLHTIQTPDNLTGITRISLKSDADPDKVRAEVRVIKYYKLAEN